MAIDLPPELSAKLQIWRSKAAAGTLTIEEARESIIILRQARFAAATRVKETKSKAKAAVRSADDLLKDL